MQGVVAIIRSPEPIDILQTGLALVEGGIRYVEVTLNTPDALDGIESLRSALGDRAQVGAGTILRPADALRAISAGSQFVVTPTLQPDSVEVCRKEGIPVLCGAMTPTEIQQAHNSGADYVKLFPAGSLGLDYIKNVLGPLPMVKIVPTGGVTLENMSLFLKVCPAVGVGSNLVDLNLVRQSDWRALSALAQQYVAEAAKG